MKTNKIREMSEDEIKTKIRDLKLALAKLKISKAKGELKNPYKIREERHEIARMLTVLAEKGRKQ